MARTVRKVPAAAKREKIVEVTLRLVADEGIEGATTARIAAAAGVSEGTLYRLYGSKRGILLAAVDAVHDHFLELMETARRDGVVETFRELGRLHTESMVGGGIDRLIAPLFAFMTAPPSLGLRELRRPHGTRVSYRRARWSKRSGRPAFLAPPRLPWTHRRS